MFGLANGHLREQRGAENAERHEGKGPDDIGQEYREANGHGPRYTQSALQPLQEAFELRRHDAQSNGQTQGPQDIVEKKEAGVDGEKGLPLAGCEGRETRLSGEDIPGTRDGDAVAHVADKAVGEQRGQAERRQFLAKGAAVVFGGWSVVQSQLATESREGIRSIVTTVFVVVGEILVGFSWVLLVLFQRIGRRGEERSGRSSG